MTLINRTNFWKVAVYSSLLKGIYNAEVTRDSTLDFYRRRLGENPQGLLEEDKGVVEIAAIGMIPTMSRHNVERPENSVLIDYLQEIKPLAAQHRKHCDTYDQQARGKGFFKGASVILSLLPQILRGASQQARLRKVTLKKLLEE